MTSRLKLLLYCMATMGLYEGVSIGVFGMKGIGAESCLIIAFAVAWAMEKEK